MWILLFFIKEYHCSFECVNLTRTKVCLIRLIMGYWFTIWTKLEVVRHTSNRSTSSVIVYLNIIKHIKEEKIAFTIKWSDNNWMILIEVIIQKKERCCLSKSYVTIVKVSQVHPSTYLFNIKCKILQFTLKIVI